MLLIAKQRQASQTTIHAQHRRACIAVRRLGAVDWMLARDAMGGHRESFGNTDSIDRSLGWTTASFK